MTRNQVATGWRIADDLSWRAVNGELVVVDVRSGDYHVLNALGAHVFLAIVDGKDASAIVASITDAYEVSADTAHHDVETFATTLMEQRLIAPREVTG